MKKIFFVLLVMVMFVSNAYCFEVKNYKKGELEILIQNTGFKILNANRIPYRIIFEVNSNKLKNAYTSSRDRSVHVYESIMPYVFGDDELAALLSHEIAHAVDLNQGIFRGYFKTISMSFNSRKYETKADKRGIDYMVKAGYNPVAMITLATKIFSQPRYDFYSTHPLGSKRVADMYEYIYTKYPEYLVDNKYKDNIYYQNFLITSKENRLKFQKKVESGSKSKVKYE